MACELLIQIINYNTKQYLEICLDSLVNDIHDKGIDYKVIVLDNNSNDILHSIEKKYQNKKVYFHYSKINLGFGGGHNFISHMEESEYTLILNPDLKFIEINSVERLLKKIKDDNRYQVIGPRLVIEDMTQQPFDHGELGGLISWMKNSYGASYWKPRISESEAAWVSGAVLMIETKLFKNSGGFDDKFFLYKEEEDLCKRIRDNGGRILYYPEVGVMHFGHVVAERSKHFSDSMNYYIDKHYRKNFSYKILHSIKVMKDLMFYGRVKERQ